MNATLVLNFQTLLKTLSLPIFLDCKLFGKSILLDVLTSLAHPQEDRTCRPEMCGAGPLRGPFPAHLRGGVGRHGPRGRRGALGDQRRARGERRFWPDSILWMVATSISHHPRKNEPLNHCLLVFTGESNHARVSERWCEMDFVHQQ